MPKLKASEEFVVGKHKIGYVSSDFKKYVDSIEFEVGSMPKFQKSGKNMKDAEIESELKPGICTLSDVLALIDNAPEECKDGWSNIFYFGAFVVYVGWRADDARWLVDAWYRGGYEWDAGSRVFSPATVPSVPVNSKSLALEHSVLKITVTAIEGDQFRYQLEAGGLRINARGDVGEPIEVKI